MSNDEATMRNNSAIANNKFQRQVSNLHPSQMIYLKSVELPRSGEMSFLSLYETPQARAQLVSVVEVKLVVVIESGDIAISSERSPLSLEENLTSSFAAGKSDKEILDNLLKNSRYDKRLLPPVDDPEFCCGLTSPNDSLAQNRVGLSSLRPRSHNRGVLTVNVSVLLLSLASPDESSLKYEVEFLLQQQWYDPRLRYSNQSHYDFLNAIHHHEDIWLPDTYFIMHGDFKDPIIPMHFALRIYRNGTINYLMRRHLILSCQGRLNIFPFDDPLCSFALESISYEQSAITYVWKNDEDTLRKSPSLTTLNAYLIQNQTIACPIKASWRAEGNSLYEEDEELTCNLCQRRFEEQGNYSCLKVDLIFTRDRAFYFTTVFIPGIILVTSSFITFWLEWNAVPARSMIGNYSCLKVDLIFTAG
ncbi:hypothetical protein MSG28_002839 [Choristoneura fumiferana]|uniref:Uncharacterized protein n=1 Tax=Choristoneura fumiferana TaxID=7141 RepID=A0ACC0JJK3_CHOFU|nr:hypothetical protein MSG28_002839 [Choristoneura fumiferana]